MNKQNLLDLFPVSWEPDVISFTERIKLFPTKKPFNFRKAKIRRKMAKVSRKINRRK
jgi:hypothetical protein